MKCENNNWIRISLWCIQGIWYDIEFKSFHYFSLWILVDYFLYKSVSYLFPPFPSHSVHFLPFTTFPASTTPCSRILWQSVTPILFIRILSFVLSVWWLLGGHVQRSFQYQNIRFRTLFSNILNLSSFFRVTGQVSHPSLHCLDRRRENK
jgi:hypothetical protein